MKAGKYSGVMVVVMALLGMILFVSMFSTIMSAINNLRYGATSLTNFIAFDTILSIAPSILWLGGLLGAGFAYYKGYSIVSGKDSSGFMRMVMGVLTLVLFVTMFLTVLSNVNTVYGSTNASNYVAFTTIVGITPTILFLAGIFASVSSGIQGYRQSRRRRGARAF